MWRAVIRLGWGFSSISCVIGIRCLDFKCGVFDKARINAYGGWWQGDSLPLRLCRSFPGKKMFQYIKYIKKVEV